MLCKICQAETKKVFIAQVLNKYDVPYFYCEVCGFLFAFEPSWLKEAYEQPINISDTGILERNISFSVSTLNIIYYFYNPQKTFLDYAGGYGVFTRLMRDIGLDFKWQDDFSPNLLARSFEYSHLDLGVELVTVFEVFEHFIDPLAEIEKILKISKNILFSTVLLPNGVPATQDWWYYGFNHGQHISFYSYKTLISIAKKYDLNYYTNGSTLHLLTTKKINPFLFKILTNYKIGIFFSIWPRFNLKSKTWADFLSLEKK